MSQEKQDASEQTPPAPSPDQFAHDAAIAQRVLAFWTNLCEPVIEANKAYLRSAKGVVTTVATVNGLRTTTFTQGTRKPYFEISDLSAFTDWADEKGETEWIIRSSFVKAILNKRARWANGEVIDGETGEVIPGVSYNKGGQPTGVTSTFTEAGLEFLDDVVREMFGPASAAMLAIGAGSAETEAGA
ncbi:MULTISPECIES: hypothetical protein [unclassified Streptomyces]|uniref:hypothetical protein n=1 Tax=unclassified Streptomyces TaxID=2593676 RepID=UPI00331B5424